MAKVFLTGGGGFLGKNIAENKPAHWQLTAPLRKELELNDENAVDGYFQNRSFDTIIHGANVGGTRKPGQDAGFIQANLAAFQNVFKHRDQATRFIQLGSGAEYSRPFVQGKVNEEILGQRIPPDEYGLAKLCCTQIVKSIDPARAVTLHIFGVFGPHEDYAVRFISSAILRSLLGVAISINRDVEFDYLYVKDCIRIIDAFSTKPARHSHYNIGSGRVVRLTEIAECVRSVLGNKHEIIVKEKTLGAPYTPSVERMHEFLGPNFVFTPLSDAVRELATWYEGRMDVIDKNVVLNPI